MPEFRRTSCLFTKRLPHAPHDDARVRTEVAGACLVHRHRGADAVEPLRELVANARARGAVEQRLTQRHPLARLRVQPLELDGPAGERAPAPDPDPPALVDAEADLRVHLDGRRL